MKFLYSLTESHSSPITMINLSVLFFVICLCVHIVYIKIYFVFPKMCRLALDAYSAELKSIGMKLINSMAKCLKMDPQEMIDLFEDSYQTVRTNYYPPCPEPDKVIGLAPHSDAVGLTILLQLSETAGLQVRKDGSWITAKPDPYAFVVNIGDILEVLINYHSINHMSCTSIHE